MIKNRKKRVAIIHYWLVNMRGGEKVLEELCEIFPAADIFTHVLDENKISGRILNHRIQTSFINRLPGAIRHYQEYLPLMPLALEQLDLNRYDLVISCESGPAKGVITSPNCVHVCYCHTPMRYLWDMYHEYLKTQNVFIRWMMRPLMHYLRLWDFASAARVDYFIANSNYVARRIQKYYKREAKVIYPPVNTKEFSISDKQGDFYLFVGQLVAYKKADLVVETFNKIDKKLVVIGDGEQLQLLKKIAKDNIQILGRQSFDVVKQHLATCKALIFPGVEDFGMVPVEAMASGRPVIAYRKGGAVETVVENETGIFFDEQTSSALVEAIYKYEKIQAQFDPFRIVEHAKGFDVSQFKYKINAYINHISGL